MVVLPVMNSFPITLSTILLAQAPPLLTPITPSLSSTSNSTFYFPVLTVSPSDINSLMHGVVKTAKNNANAPYTILLVGETGVGKSSFLMFIANVLLGNDVHHYDRDILDHPYNGPGVVGQTASSHSSHLYEITSVSGLLVSARVINTERRDKLFLRFVSSTRLGWDLALLSKMRPTKRI